MYHMPGPQSQVRSVTAFHTNSFQAPNTSSSVPHRVANNQPNPNYYRETLYITPMNNNNMYSNRDSLRLIGSASEEMLYQSGNQAYMQLVMENLRLKNQILELLYARYNGVPDLSSTKIVGFHEKIELKNRNPHLEYLQASTNNPAQVLLLRRAAFLQATFQLAHKEPNIVLKQEDYPAVKYWISESFAAWFSNQPVVNRRVARGEISIKDYFLEDKHGNLVSYNTISSIRRYLKITFAKIQQHMPELLGITSSELDQELLKLLCHELRVIHPELALCAQDWKVLVILSRWYSYWNRKRSGQIGGNTCEDDEYFQSKTDDDSTGETSDSYASALSTSKVAANSAPDAFSVTKHEGPTSATLKRPKITDPVENPPYSVVGTANMPPTIKYENQDDKTSVAFTAWNGIISSSYKGQLASFKAKEPAHRRQKVTNSIYPRNLCAKEWKKSRPNGTTKEFREYWESIGATGRLKWINLSKALKKEQTATTSGQGGA